MSSEKYLKPEVIHQIRRLDLRAQFVAKGFLQGLHSSPLTGFSVEFSEHRKLSPGDDPKDIDWLVYAKTDKYYVKKFEAETHIHGYLVMDLSHSMDYTLRQELSKFDYAVCLAAALCYLMIQQQDPVGLVTFGDAIQDFLPPHANRKQFGNVLSILSRLKPSGTTNIGKSIAQLGAMLRHQSLVMMFSDLLCDVDELVHALRVLRHGGHDVILFHVLDEAEVSFPFDGPIQLRDPESAETIDLNGTGFRMTYLDEIKAFRERLQTESTKHGVDFVPLDTSMAFDKALMEYLLTRQARF